MDGTGTALKEYLRLAVEHLSNLPMQLFTCSRLLVVKVGTSELY